MGTWVGRAWSRPGNSTPTLFLTSPRHMGLSLEASLSLTPSQSVCRVLNSSLGHFSNAVVFSPLTTSNCVSQRTGARLLCLSWVEKYLGTHVALARPLPKSDICTRVNVTLSNVTPQAG